MLNLDDYRWMGECQPHHECRTYTRNGRTYVKHYHDCLAIEIRPLLDELERIYALKRDDSMDNYYTR